MADEVLAHLEATLNAKVERQFREAVAGMPGRLVIAMSIEDPGRSVIMLDPTFDDPAVWGQLLHDIIQHVAHGYVRMPDAPGTQKEIATTILAALNAEALNPRAEVLNDVVHRTLLTAKCPKCGTKFVERTSNDFFN